MNLQIVTGKAFTIQCVKCGKKSMSDIGLWYADLEGKPFKDYYCENCKNKLERKMKTVKVNFSDGDSITTDINPNCSDDEIRDYYRIGRTFNLGIGDKDNLVKVKSIEIFK